MQISYFLITIYMEEFHEEESHHPELSLYIFVFLSVHGTMFSIGWESLKQTWLNFLTELEDQCSLTLVHEFTGPKSM